MDLYHFDMIPEFPNHFEKGFGLALKTMPQKQLNAQLAEVTV